MFWINSIIYGSASKSSLSPVRYPRHISILLVYQSVTRRTAKVYSSYYSHLPPQPPKQTLSRTFTILPATTHPTYPKWVRASNNLATDEVSAHMGMFNPKTNDGFYELGLEVVHVIGERIEEEGVGRATSKCDGGAEKFSAGNEGEKDGWREEKDSQGRIIWVET